MFIRSILALYATHLARRCLALKEHPPSSPQKPDKNNSYLLYIHIPFCEELCPFCSFVTVKFEPSLACRYFDALLKEIEIYNDLGYRFDSIYIGGGTPTVMPDKLAQVIEYVKSNWRIKHLSVETNPNHLTPEVLRILKDVGTNRLSIGVQSFNNEILESIQRLEKYGSGQEIRERLACVVGMFDTVNVDMIFNLPSQTERMLAADCEIIKQVGTDQVTYYPLITSKCQRKKIAEACGIIDYKREKRLYQLLVEELADTYNQESIWCFSSKKGLIDEYIVNHDEYAGIGSGSLGYVNGTMYCNTCSIQQYIDVVQDHGSPVIASRSFSYLEKMRHYFLFKLLGGALSISDMKERYGNHSWLCLSPKLLCLLITRSITIADNSITLTPRGRYYWVILMRTLFAVVGDYRQTRVSIDAARYNAS
jgi:coproporphyrinogen III oxidase-like Fe-S oxidoreductase